MATSDDVAALRRATGITDTAAPYTDQFLSDLIDAMGGVAPAAAQLWREKAATAADFVDTTESGSSRKLSQIQANALAMAAGFEAVSTTGSGARSFTTAIERQ